MENRKLITAELFERLTNENDLLSKIITGNETQVFAYDLEIKLQSSEWHILMSSLSKKKKKKARVIITIEDHVYCIL
jgi:FixJ family two-component response regulator